MSTTDEDRPDPTAAILADLESLRASRQPADEPEDAEADPRSDARALLDDIAEVAGHLRDREPERGAASARDARDHDEDEAETAAEARPARKSARASVANRGLVFESYIADTHEADDDAEVAEDEDREPSAAASASRNPFSPFSHSSGAPAGEFTPFTAPAGGGLLFQAPQEELAQPVESDWFDDEDDEDEQGGYSGDEEPSGGDVDSEDRTGDDTDDDSDDDGRGRSRRRRGGRGRRSRSRGRDGEGSGDEGEDRDGSADSAQADADEDSDDDRRNRRGRRRRGGEARSGESKKTSDSKSGDGSAEGRSGDSAGDAEGSGGAGKDAEGSQGSGGDQGAGKEQSGRRKGEDSPRGGASGREDGAEDSEDEGEDEGSRRRRRRRARGSRREGQSSDDEVTGVKGSTRLEAKRQRRREGREAGRRRPLLTEAEFLARRESVTRTMLVREQSGRTQLAVLEDGIAVEHYLSEHRAQASLIGNVYLGKVQNVLPSMEAAFIDIGKGRNAVLYAGEVNWDALGMNGKPHRIEQALSSGDHVLVQVTKDPVGHKGARLTSQISLPGRFLVYIPGNSMTGISRKLPDNERARLKKLLKEILPADAGVIVRTASEGASDEELRRDVERLSRRWETITKKSQAPKTSAPKLLYSEPDMIVRIIRDVFNEDFDSLVIDGDSAWDTIHEYVEAVAPDLLERVSRYGAKGTATAQAASEGTDIFDHFRVSEQIEKALSRKVNLPSGGSLVIDRTEAMTVIDVNTGKFTGSGGNLEETVTKNNLEAAEEVIRQLRLRDIGGIIVVDFIDMVLEANRDLVTRRLVECLARDRTRHQVAEVTSLGLVQMTRKRIGTGLAESFTAAGEDLSGRGLLLPGTEPGEQSGGSSKSEKGDRRGGRRKGRGQDSESQASDQHEADEKTEQSRSAVAAIAKATLKHDSESAGSDDKGSDGSGSKRRGAGAKDSSARGSAEKDAGAQDGSGDAGSQQRSEGGAEESEAPRKRSRSRRSRSRGGSGEARTESSSAGDSREEAASAQEGAASASVPAATQAPAEIRTPEPAPEPSGPAPLMIGADTVTSIQRKAPVKAAPAERAAAAEAPNAAGEGAPVKQAASAKEEAPKAAAPILLIGMDD